MRQQDQPSAIRASDCLVYLPEQLQLVMPMCVDIIQHAGELLLQICTFLCSEDFDYNK